MTFSYSVLAQSVQWRDQHKVKRKETIFGIAKSMAFPFRSSLMRIPP